MYCFLLGEDITLVAHSKSVQVALDAAIELEKEDIDCEVSMKSGIIGKNL